MMIMLLIPRLLVAVAVMLIITDVGVIAMRLSFSGWLSKPIPYSKSRSPDFQTTHQENIYQPYEHPIPYFKSHSPYFQTTHEENIYRPYEHDLSSGIDSYNRKPSDKNNDDSDSFARFLRKYHFEPNDKNNDDSKIQKLMKPLKTDHQVSTPFAPVNRKPIPYSKSRSPDFQTTHEENIYQPYEPPLPVFKSYLPYSQTAHEENIYRSFEHDLSSRFASYGRKSSNYTQEDLKIQKLMKPLETDHQVSTPFAPVNRKEDAFQYFLNKSKMPKKAHGRLILSAPVNQTVNATREQPQNPEVTTISTAITADTQLVDELQDPSTNLGKGLGLLILSDPVNLEEPSTWDFTKTSRGPQVKTPGATVEHNLEEKKLPTNKNLVQP